MKKTIAALVFLSLVAVSAIASYLYTGGGAIVSVTTTPQSISVPNGDHVYTSMLWTSEGECRVLKNCSVADFVATNGIPVGAYPPVVLSGVAISKTITNVVVATESGTATLYIKWE